MQKKEIKGCARVVGGSESVVVNNNFTDSNLRDTRFVGGSQSVVVNNNVADSKSIIISFQKLDQ